MKDISRYNNGFGGPVSIFGQPTTFLNRSTFWVGNDPSGAAKPMSDGNDGSEKAPFATLDYAVGQSSSGDVIFINTGHTETVSAASAITIDVNNIAIVGLGNGTNQPSFSFSSDTAASIVISSNNVSISNIEVVPTLDSIVNAFEVSGSDCSLDITVRETSDLVEFVRAVYATGARLTANVNYYGRTGGDACINGIRLEGVDGAKITGSFYGKPSTAWVEFETTACTDVEVNAFMFVSGTTDGSKNVVDTVTGSTWFSVIEDGSASDIYIRGNAGNGGIALAAALLEVPVADSTDNVYERDVIGNKEDAAVITVGTTASSIAYIKGLLNQLGTISNTAGTPAIGEILGDFANTTLVSKLNVATIDSVSNLNISDQLGNKEDAAVSTVGTANSQMAYLKGITETKQKFATTAAGVMVNDDPIFTVSGGEIDILSLVSTCVTNNDATGSTLQYSIVPTVGSEQTISGASASIANATAGATVALQGTTLATAALYNANGPNLIAGPGLIHCPAGTIKIVIGTGSTTGTWKHTLTYKPKSAGVTVS